MTAWRAPEGDGEDTIAALIAAIAGGMGIVLWSQRPEAGDAAIDAVLALSAATTAAAVAAVWWFRRRRRALTSAVGGSEPAG